MAGFHSLHGNWELTGPHWINDDVFIASPICITNTHSVGTVHQATTKWMTETYKVQFLNNHLWAYQLSGNI